jgi:hypothetical protein
MAELCQMVAKTYVFNGGKEWLVSTINRPSSAIDTYGAYYAETLVFPLDKDRQMGDIVFRCEDICGSVFEHCRLVMRMAKGEMKFQRPEAKEEAEAAR